VSRPACARCGHLMIQKWRFGEWAWVHSDWPCVPLPKTPWVYVHLQAAKGRLSWGPRLFVPGQLLAEVVEGELVLGASCSVGNIWADGESIHWDDEATLCYMPPNATDSDRDQIGRLKRMRGIRVEWT
jgi:hypothetical protein